MPCKNSVKVYIKDGFYHIYNRGVEKRIIFKDAQDYKVFLKYLKESLSPPPDPKKYLKTFTLKGQTFKGIPRQPKNFSGEIDLLAYCLMPNHFHLLIKQTENKSVKDFMQSLISRYSMYFNKRYERVGSLFQGRYKAVLITEESYLLHLSRYIHLNPLEYTKNLAEAYSSYSDYLRQRKTPWVKPDIIISFFEKKTLPFLQKMKPPNLTVGVSSPLLRRERNPSEAKTLRLPVSLRLGFSRRGINSYKDFVEKYEEKSGESLAKLTLED